MSWKGGDRVAHAAGVDGCKGGWLCISRRNGGLVSSVYKSGKALLSQEQLPGIVAIDIPIGLADLGTRECDARARQMLGKRACCVFTAPIRSVLAARTYQEACEIRSQAEGKRLSKQAWNILDKILEVDDVLRANRDLSARVFEVHPELCFMAWNGGVPVAAGKKSADGRAYRRKLVESYFGGSAFALIRDAHPRAEVADDDINDAFAALWTADRILGGTSRRIPDVAPLDRHGLRMEMVW